jgi:putative membrane protein insertion efficiency factor
MKKLVLKIIKLYQKTLSLDHGPLAPFYPFGWCRFKPTCSEYAIQAIEKYGIVKGGVLAAKRVLRCNPFSRGGYDPVK